MDILKFLGQWLVDNRGAMLSNRVSKKIEIAADGNWFLRKIENNHVKTQIEFDVEAVERIKKWALEVIKVEKNPEVTYDWLVKRHLEILEADWDYDFGIKIETMDNPGWSLSAYCRGTELKNKKFEKICIGDSEDGDDWLSCLVEDDVFKGYSDPDKLQTVLEMFFNWTEKHPAPLIFDKSNVLSWLGEWFKSYCDEDWEHSYGIDIYSIDNPGWMVSINLWETDLADIPFEPITNIVSDDDWFACKIEDDFFKGSGDPSKLSKILETFKNWAEDNSIQKA